MNHMDHVRLLSGGVPRGEGGTWADMGSGTGAFTLALRDLAGPQVDIWSVDRDRHALSEQRLAVERAFPGTRLHTMVADFTGPLDLVPLQGIVAANSVHFVRDAVALLTRRRMLLAPSGRLILVEYDTDEGNRWVPYPISWRSLPAVARAAGFGEPAFLSSHPSRFLRRIYSAVLIPRP